MSRRKKSREAAGVQLFPFLAVLLCAMGALIVVLMIVAQQARAHAREAAARPDPELAQRRASRQADQEEWTEQAKELREQMASSAALLLRKQEEVKGLQDALGKTLRDVDQVRAAQEDLAKASRDPAQAQQVQQQATQVDAKIRDAQAALKDRKRAAAQVPQLFSIVPYVGRNGAPRRPIYIECRGQSIILQPEGTELAASDFEVLGPGNPLEAAVRASLAYWENTLGKNAGAPYPLLLVRPDGVSAYHAAREALSTWGGEFGYELIDAQWNVALPKPDPQLARRQQIAIGDAREQMRRLAQLETRRRKSSPSFKIGSDGTLQRDDSADDDEERPRRRNAFGAPVAAEGTPGKGGFGGGASAGFSGREPSAASPPGPSVLNDGPLAARPSPRPGQADTGAAGFAPQQTAPGASDPPSFFGGGAGAGNDRENGPMFGPRGTVQRGGSMAGSDATMPGGSSELPMDLPRVVSGAGGHGAGTGQFPPRNPGGAAVSARAGLPSENQPGPGNGGTARVPTPGQGGVPGGTPGAAPSTNPGAAGAPGGPAAAPSSGDNMAGGTSGPGGASLQPPEDAAASVGMTANAAGTNCQCIADKQGANWALPDRPNRVSSPIRRTVRLVIDGDTITIFSDPRGSQTLKIIRLTRNTTEAVDELKTAVWRIMETWGDAPQGLHWRPVLLASVNPRGALRYQELSVLLRGSGFELTDSFTTGP